MKRVLFEFERLIFRFWIVLLLAAPALAQPASFYAASRHGGPYMFNHYLPPVSSTPWAPSWSPDGKWIAVAMSGSIWKVDPETGLAVELTAGRTYHSLPGWSPDGQWIIYAADDDSKTIQLEIVNVRTGESRTLTEDRQIYADPVFSPDGRRVAYVSTWPNGFFNIYVREIRDGRWAGEPVAVTEDHPYVRDRPYVGRIDMNTQPAWTPDGKELVFVSNRDVPLGSGDLWRAPAERHGIQKGSLIWREQSLYRTRPHVSVDGKRIVYASHAGGADQFTNLYVIPTTGGAPYKLTFGEYDHFHPRWSPDGEWIAFISNQEGLPQLALLETYGGEERIIRIAERKWKRPVGRLHVRAIDASTGKLTAFRAHGTETDGKFYAPKDAYALISMTGQRCFFSRGEFTVALPPGELTIEAVKGFEYEPVRQRAAVKPGQTTELTLVLKRIATLPAQGWYSGSTHVHMNYGGNLRNTPERLAWMAASEDLHIVSALIANMDNRIFDWQYFRRGGGEYPLSGGPPGVKVLFAEEYRPPFPGHVFMIGMRDHLISPFVTGYEGTAIESLYPSNTDMFRKARAQGAIGGYVHPFGESDPLESGLGAKHFPVDAALGTVDCLEWSNAIRAQHRVWHRMLNNDFPIVPVGGEDSITDLHNRKLIGNIRTYAYLGQDLRVEAWVEAIRKGRTFFSTGPLLEFRINDQIPGGRLRLPAGGGKVTISGSVRSIAPLNKLTLYHRSGAYKQIPLNADGKGARFTETIAVEHSDWFSITAEGPRYPALDTEFPLATTNAIRVYVGEEKVRDRESAEYFIRWIDKLKVITGQWPWWRSQAEKDHIYGQYEQARRVYERLAEEADR